MEERKELSEDLKKIQNDNGFSDEKEHELPITMEDEEHCDDEELADRHLRESEEPSRY